MSMTIGEMRQEMARLAVVVMKKNHAYLKREAELINESGQDDGLLQVRMRDDITLKNASGAARTCADLATALASVIQAEIAYAEHNRKGPR